MFRKAIISGNYCVCVVFRLESTDVENVCIRTYFEGRKQVAFITVRARANFGVDRLFMVRSITVADYGGSAAVSAEVVITNDLRIGDDLRGECHGAKLSQKIPSPAKPIPLGALPLNAVDVNRDGDAAEPWQPNKWAVGRVADKEDIGRMAKQVEKTAKGVDRRFQIFVFGRWQQPDSNPTIERLRILDNVGSTVDRDVVTEGY